MEPFANPAWQVVVATVIALVAARIALSRAKSTIGKQVAELAESLAIAIFLVFLVVRPFVVQAYFIPSASMRPTLIEGDRILVNKFIYRLSDPKFGDVVVFKSPIEANKDQKDFIKRVIGLPGDSIAVRPGYVKIGGVKYFHDRLRTALSDYLGSPNMLDTRVLLKTDGVYVDGRKMTDNEIATAANKPNARIKIYPGVVLRNGKPLRESYIAEDPDREYPNMPGDVDKVAKGDLFVMGDNRNKSHDSTYWGLLDRSRVEGKAMFIFWPLDRIRWLR